MNVTWQSGTCHRSQVQPYIIALWRQNLIQHLHHSPLHLHQFEHLIVRQLRKQPLVSDGRNQQVTVVVRKSVEKDERSVSSANDPVFNVCVLLNSLANKTAGRFVGPHIVESPRCPQCIVRQIHTPRGRSPVTFQGRIEL